MDCSGTSYIRILETFKSIDWSIPVRRLEYSGFRLQSMGVHISQYLVDMVPYAATILIVIISTHKNKKEDMGPADLSVPYFREDR